MSDKFLDLCRSGDFVYPDAYSRYYKISIEETYKILDEYCKSNILKRVYNFRCPNCSYTINNYESLGEVEDYTYCSNCDEEFDREAVFDYSIVIYKKV